MKPLAIDLFCGLGGWAEGFLAEGFDVVGFDIERRPYPGWLVLQDVETLHGSQFRGAAVIVASPPCQGYSYRAMPWKRAKALPPPDNTLFNAPFRIAMEAGLPVVVENVRGAQKWVGRAKWHYGSFYLWGDLPALMVSGRVFKTVGHTNKRNGFPSTKHLTNQAEFEGVKQGGDWFGKNCETSLSRMYGSKSSARKAASAQIAKIPLPLARHIARCFKP